MTHNLLKKNFGISRFREHNTRRKNKRLLLREFDLPLSEIKKELLTERQKTGTRVNGQHREIELVFTKNKVKVYAI